MGQRFVYEDATVYAVMAGGEVIPKAFEVAGRQVIIREVTCTRRGRLATANALFFEVIGDDGALYKLCYFPEETRWLVDAPGEEQPRRRK